MSALDAIRAYAEAKSRADVAAALENCTDDVVVETYPFQIASVGAAETREQLDAFFVLFPDYAVVLERLVAEDDVAVGWGTISATMSGDIGPVVKTGRSFTVPFTCVWQTREGLIARERFYFDLNHVCEQLGVSTSDVAAVLHQVAEAYTEKRATTAA